MNENTVDYYRRRAEQERRLSDVAINPEIASIHAEMANRYCVLIEQAVLEPLRCKKLSP